MYYIWFELNPSHPMLLTCRPIIAVTIQACRRIISGTIQPIVRTITYLDRAYSYLLLSEQVRHSLTSITIA